MFAWMKTLYVKLGGLMLLLLALCLFLVVSNMHGLSALDADLTKAVYASKGRAESYRLLYLADRLFDEQTENRSAVAGEMREAMAGVARRLEAQMNGDPTIGLPAETDARFLLSIRERQDLLRGRIQPAMQRIIDAPTREAASGDLALLRNDLRSYADKAEAAVTLKEEHTSEVLARLTNTQQIFAGMTGGALVLAIWVVAGISRRARSLARTADQIAAGDLTITAPVKGGDELAVLGAAFNSMTAKLRSIIQTESNGRAKLEEVLAAVTETVNSLVSASAEILAGTSQQAAGAQEQAAAVSETVSTVDEVLQTSEQAAERAKAVAEAAQRSVEVSKAGRGAVEQSVLAMGTVKEQAESIAESIVALAEQAQAIGEIIAAVNDIAEQTNLLALNAAIEASRAGEHGRGFTVVANEVKALADQSKRSTAQVRQILSDIQRATNGAVVATEKGTKSVDTAITVVRQAGDTIKTLAETIAEAAQAAGQISGSAGQQATGIAQIHQAMKSINEVTHQNLSSTRQAERAAQDLNTLGVRLKGLVAA